MILLRKLIIILIISPSISWSSTEINLVRSQFEALSQNVLTSSTDQRDEFARIALSELYNAYENELMDSYHEQPSELSKVIKLNRWRQATKNYMGQISYALQQVLGGEHYEMDIDAQGIILFMASDFTVMITGLNEKTDDQLERNIIKQFCNLYDCQAYLSKDEKSYIEDIVPVVTGYWLIDKRHKADYFTYNGILFRFNNLNNRSAKEDWSKRITQDLLTLNTTLEITRKKQYSVDLPSLEITRINNKDGRILLNLNQQNDYIAVDLPAASRVEGIIELVKHWLSQPQSVRQDSNTAIILPSEQLYAQP